MANQHSNTRGHNQERQAQDIWGNKGANDPEKPPMSAPMIPGDTEATKRHRSHQDDDPTPLKSDTTAGSE